MINFLFFLVLNILIIFQLEAKFKINKLLDLNNPWGLTFLDEKNMLITEKEGKIKLFNFLTMPKFFISQKS